MSTIPAGGKAQEAGESHHRETLWPTHTGVTAAILFIIIFIIAVALLVRLQQLRLKAEL